MRMCPITCKVLRRVLLCEGSFERCLGMGDVPPDFMCRRSQFDLDRAQLYSAWNKFGAIASYTKKLGRRASPARGDNSAP